ncbi:MAG: amidohydrolase family protein [Bacillota bacterium]
MAAAAGGVTTVLEMPISQPSVHTVEILEQRKLLAAAGATVDYGFYGAAGEDNLAEIPGLAAAGVVGFKTFLHGPPPGRESEFKGLCCTNEGALLEVLRAVAGTGLPAAIHAESDAICSRLQERLKAQGRRDGMAHAASRPEVAEIAAAASALALAEATGVSLHLCHTSVPRVVEMAVAARERGANVTVETCPQYLFATVDDLARLGPLAKCNPPLRSHSTVRGLWDCVREKLCDIIASDHSPYHPDDKLPYAGDIWKAAAGLPGLETTLPLLLTAVSQGQLDMTDLARMLSLRPAQVFGLYPKKGVIEPGPMPTWCWWIPGANRSLPRRPCTPGRARWRSCTRGGLRREPWWAPWCGVPGSSGTAKPRPGRGGGSW